MRAWVSKVTETFWAFSTSSWLGVWAASWEGVGQLLWGILTNPYLLVSCLWGVWNAVNDPTTAGLGDSGQALTYEDPKKGDKPLRGASGKGHPALAWMSFFVCLQFLSQKPHQ